MYSIQIEDGLDFNRYEKRGFLAGLFAAATGAKDIKIESTSLPAADKGQTSYIALLRKNDGLWDILEKKSQVSAESGRFPSIKENIKLVCSGLAEKAARDFLADVNRAAEALWKQKEIEKTNRALARKLMM